MLSSFLNCIQKLFQNMCKKFYILYGKISKIHRLKTFECESSNKILHWSFSHFDVKRLKMKREKCSFLDESVAACMYILILHIWWFTTLKSNDWTNWCRKFKMEKATLDKFWSGRNVFVQKTFILAFETCFSCKLLNGPITKVLQGGQVSIAHECWAAWIISWITTKDEKREKK